MKNEFYRPEIFNLSKFEAIITKMRKDLAEDGFSMEEALAYIKKIIEDAKPLPRRDRHLYIGFDDPSSMPRDAFNDYIVRPTAIAAAIITKCIFKYPRLFYELDEYEYEAFQGVLNTASFAFTGEAYLEIKGKLDAIELFLDGHAAEFITENTTYSLDFTNRFLENIEFLRTKVVTGEACDGFGVKVTYEKEAAWLLKRFDEQTKKQ